MSDYERKAEEFLQKHGIKFKATFTFYGAHFVGETESRDNFRCTFSRGRSRFTISFGQSVVKSDGGGGNPPHPYDVLSCITKQDPESFEDFCGEFGYDTDSRKAEATYKAVRSEWAKVSAFFSPEELDEAREIQ